MPEMFDRVKNLSEQIDKTENMKDAQDLNNRILLELVQIQLAQLSMQMQFEKAGALVNYQGIQDETLKQRADIISKAKNEMEAIGWLNDKLNSKGINPNKASFESMVNWEPQ